MRKILFLFLLLSINSLFSQKKGLTIEDIVTNPQLYPVPLKNIQWISDKDNFSFIAKNKLVVGNCFSDKKDSILGLDDLNPKIKKAIKKEDIFVEDMKVFPEIKWVDENSFVFIHEDLLLKYDLSDKKATLLNKFNKDAQNIDYDTSTFSVAYTINNQLFVSKKENEINLSNEQNKNIIFGQSVHRNEFGINKGTFWSPKGMFLAFYRMDESMVADYPIINTSERIAKAENIKYPMAGMTSHQVKIGIYNNTNDTIIYLKTKDSSDHYLTNITWAPDESYIYVVELNREQTHLKLNEYDPNNGNFIRTLIEEHNDKWIEPLSGMNFLISKPDNYLWLSKRDGFNHLYLYSLEDTTGQPLEQITKGEWNVIDFLGFDFEEKRVIFSANADDPLSVYLYSAELRSGVFRKVSIAKGVHTGIISKSRRNILDIYNNPTTPYQVDILTYRGTFMQNVYKFNNPIRNMKIGDTKIFTIKADDGETDLYCRLIKPLNMQEGKKYPVIVYVYGGPHVQLIKESWLNGASLFLYYLAQQGYVVFTLDNRGSDNRGLKFEQAIHKNLGIVEAKDQYKGIEYLKKLDFVDTTRIGIHGWSFGGFMTINMMETYPNIFKVGVAGGPVIDWKYYEVMYGERYMQTPQKNPEGYTKTSLLNNVDKIKGRLLVIHGDADPVVVWQNSLEFIKKTVDEEIQADYFVYPGHEHNVMGKDRIHLNNKIYQYFKDNL
ncbi:MAG: hypothetical protein A2X12_06525 [Bacteroidetes bacterium GWE2_29_8]|nr:MAG: hypothetical protein A2X12_06525 [Bacteroidetes bacterium GWE2_29_8]